MGPRHRTDVVRMVRVLLVTVGLSCTSAREPKGRRQFRRWLTVVSRRMVRGMYVRDTPPRGEGVQPEDHERDKLNDDPTQEAGSRNA